MTYLHSSGRAPQPSSGRPHTCPTTKPHHSHVFAAGRGAAGALLTERGLIAPPALAAVAVAGATEAALLPPDVQTAFCRLLALAGAALVVRRAPALATVAVPALCGGKPLCSWSCKAQGCLQRRGLQGAALTMQLVYPHVIQRYLPWYTEDGYGGRVKSGSWSLSASSGHILAWKKPLRWDWGCLSRRGFVRAA